jgi:hypothetical protein
MPRDRLRTAPATVEKQRCRRALLLVVLLHSDAAGVDASICGRATVSAFADDRLETDRASGASDAARQNWYQRGAAMWPAPPRLNGSRRCLGRVAWKGQGRGAQADVAFRALRSPVSATFQTGWRPSRPRQRDHRVHAERRTCSWRDDCSSRSLVEGGAVPRPGATRCVGVELAVATADAPVVGAGGPSAHARRTRRRRRSSPAAGPGRRRPQSRVEARPGSDSHRSGAQRPLWPGRGSCRRARRGACAASCARRRARRRTRRRNPRRPRSPPGRDGRRTR